MRLRKACVILLALLAAAPACTQPSAPPERLRHDSEIVPTAGRSEPDAPAPALANAGPPPSEPDVFDTSAIRADALIVNGQAITVSDILEPIDPQLTELARTMSADLYYRRVAELVRQQIIDEVATLLIFRRASRRITEELEPNIQKVVELMERERINREFGGRETSYENHLQRQNKTRQQVLDRLRRDVIVDSYLRERILPMIPAPRKQELMQYYREHLADYSTPGRREVSIIDVPIASFLDKSRSVAPDDRARAEAEARAAIDAAHEALRRGESFEDVARRHSRFKQADAGYWGFLTEPLQERWETPSRRAFEMGENEISDVIVAARSFFIVKTGRVEPGHTQSFEQAQPDIVDKIRGRRFNRARAEFLQRELETSTIGSLDAFVAQVMLAAPRPQTP